VQDRHHAPNLPGLSPLSNGGQHIRRSDKAPVTTSWRYTVNTRFQRITPFLWFHNQAEEAAHFYVSVFDNSRIINSTHYGNEAAKASGMAEGTVMTIAFELDGQTFTALNGGPVFTLTPAVSLVVNCHTQEEVDHYWNLLSKDGDPAAQQCGWLKDRYGLSWQIVPTQLVDILSQSDPGKAQRAMQAVMKMKKIDLVELQRVAA
jgi:predicted 3-demethylubiquinone-9 3-methyltransferase (glyoxalase superfamily)